MLKKICTFGLLSAAALVMSPAAHAQSLQTNVQNAHQNAAAVGPYSTVDQTQDLTNYQDVSGYPYSYPYGSPYGSSYSSSYGHPTGENQRSIQNADQNGAAVGAWSTVTQDQDLYNTQDTSSYGGVYPF